MMNQFILKRILLLNGSLFHQSLIHFQYPHLIFFPLPIHHPLSNSLPESSPSYISHNTISPVSQLIGNTSHSIDSAPTSHSDDIGILPMTLGTGAY